MHARTLRRELPGVVVAFAIAALTWIIIGAPDFPAAVRFLTSAAPDVEAAGALAGLLCWLVLAVLLLSVLFDAARNLRRSVRAVHPTTRAALLLCAAIVLFSASLIHRNATAMPCCASSAQVQEVLQLAH